MINTTQPFHPTTEGALAALRELAENHDFRNILDMGCGAGILSVTAGLLWPQANLTAADLDAGLVEAARENLYQNFPSPLAGEGQGGGKEILAIRSNGFSSPILAERGPYDLIVCNILAEPILAMLGDLASHLTPGGTLVLSGLLAWLLAPIEAALPALKLKVLKSMNFGDWRTVIILQQ